MPEQTKTIFVYESFLSEIPTQIGTLYIDSAKGTKHFSFEYSKEWLKRDEAQTLLDPDIGVFPGRQYPVAPKTLFGMISDTCPDRWGRVLMKRREMIRARKEDRKPKELRESDFLLGVYDESRMGGLRFSLQENGPFLSDDREMATPPWARLRTLEEASRAFEKDENLLEEKWLKQLLGPGSSLGGARPKATVQDTDGSLWIAKFPSKHDEYNTGAWEKVVHDLAKLCGLDVPPSKLETFSRLGSTFLVKRFDRTGTRRIHFASAMTMLGQTDGASAADGIGYLDLVSFLRSHGAEPKKDLKELWGRVVFNMAVSNTDDHLRNHGFLWTRNGWRLSPMYDVNPNPFGDTLSLNVSKNDNSMDLSLALETASYYDLTESEAKALAHHILETVRDHWIPLAKQYQIGPSAIEYMRPAFSACSQGIF